MTEPEDRDGSIDPTRDPETGSAQDDAWVARLLARTPDEPLPDSVAARLDATLAELVADRRPVDSADNADGPAADADPGVPSLDARRNRTVQRLVRGLLATAAVLVLLVGGAYMTTHLAPPGGFGGSNESASSDSGGSRADAGPGSKASSPALSPLTDSAGDAVVPSLTTARFAEQARALVSGASLGAAASGGTTFAQRSSPSGNAALARCSPIVAATAERGIPVLLDGEPVVLEVYPVSNGRRLVRAVGCDGAPLTSASIAAP